MKRLLPLFIIALSFSSCQEDVQFSNPGFQALKDDVFWRANDARAYISPTGKLTIEAYTEYELLTLSTIRATAGKYILGTTNSNNSATYSSTFNDIELEYATLTVPGPVGTVAVVAGGTGYTNTTSAVATTGGSGSGLTVNIDANASGAVTKVTPSARGNGYVAGDLITISGGNVNATFRILNVQISNGEIEITEYDTENATVSGIFKFNATPANTNPLASPILNYQNGEFYKIPIFPSN